MAFNNPRNRAIYALRKDGTSYRKLASQYNLSVERVRQICFKMERIEKYIKNPPEKTEELVNPVNYLLSKYSDEEGHNQIVRGVNCICRTMIKQGRDNYRDYREFLKALATMSYDDCLKMRNCGIKTAEMLMRIKEKECV